MYTLGMTTQIRHQAILDQLRRDGRVDVGALADELDVSPITVRRHISAGVAKLGVTDRDAAMQTLAAESFAAA